jgi:hypothetical protein
MWMGAEGGRGGGRDLRGKKRVVMPVFFLAFYIDSSCWVLALEW